MTFERTLITVLLWALCFVVLPMQAADKSRFLDPQGPDAYMRLERVNLLAQSGSWYENQIERAGGLEGADIHWTRPLDVLILATAVPLLPFMDLKAAIELGGVVLPVLLSLALVFLCIWAVRPFMQPNNLILIVLLLAVQPLIHDYLGMGRADHHALLAVLMAAVLGFLIRSSFALNRASYPIWAGVLSALALWVSIEFLVIYAPIVAGLGISWLFWAGHWRRVSRDYTVASLAVLSVCFAIDTPVQDWAVDRYDRVSIPQLLLIFLPVLFWMMVGVFRKIGQSIFGRAMTAAIFGICSLALLYFVSPNLFIGPVAEADPRIEFIWHDKVAEMSPLIDNWRQGIWYLFLPLVCLIYCGLQIFGRKETDRRPQWLWISLVLVTASFFALAHTRTALYLAVVTVIIAGPMIEDMLVWINDRYDGWKKSATGMVVRGLFVIGPFCVALSVSAISRGIGSAEAVTSRQDAPQACNVKELAEFLTSDTFTSRSNELRFVNGIEFGPELLYRIPHHFLAVPYHRNGDSIFDTYELLTTEDFGKSKEILDKYQIGYILLCPNSSDETYYQEMSEDKRLYNRLITGDLPEEITAIAAPAQWRLYEYKVAQSEPKQADRQARSLHGPGRRGE
ncbi:MAG: hypothetical protein NXI13_10375 [Proteobacteria bacterium]|nr:hypothetical protein [Pseudomonadota bacterium]